jgi:hypothetical protein
MRWTDRTWVRAVGAVLLGAGGFALAWGVWHLYQDHQNLHVLVQLEMQRRQAPALPAPGAGT